MDYNLGKLIKELRQYYSFSQKQLAEDICDQSLISRIERGDVYPTAPLLHEFSLRLGVDINYFFSDYPNPTPKLDYVRATINEIRSAIKAGHFTEALKMIEIEKKNPLFRKRELQQILKWEEGICVYYVKNSFEEGKKLLEEALALGYSQKKVYSAEEIEIMISLAIFHSEAKLLEEATELFLKALKHFKRLPYIKDEKVEIRLYYNLSKTHHQRGLFDDAIKFADLGIRTCKQQESFYLLGYCYYQKGESFLYKGNHKQALFNMNQSLWVFDYIENKVLANYIREEIKKITNNQHPKDFSDVDYKK